MEAEKIRLPERGTRPWMDLIERLASELLVGGVAVLPAEGLYGLHASGEVGLDRLREVKRSEEGRPFIALIPAPETVTRYAAGLPAPAGALIRDAWPGPLTLVLPARADVNPAYTQDGSIAVRCPGEDLLRALADVLPEPLFSTSANLGGEPAPACFEAVSAAVWDQCVLGVDDGPRSGTGSTLARIDAEGNLTILRQGLWKPGHSS